jgi:hypothetical protein
MSRQWTDEAQFNIYDYKELVIERYDEQTWIDLISSQLTEDEITNIADTIEDIVDMEHAELNSMCSVFTTADRILTKEGDVRVKTYKPTADDEGQYDGVSGWSDGKTVMFNLDVVRALSETDLTALNGLNYHELCHLIYTPRAGSELIQWAVKNKVQRAMNYLEDMRIETLFTARFPSTRLFLESNFISYVANHDVNNNDTLFLLTRGRRYIPLAIRQRIADCFIEAHGIKVAQEVADVVDQYRTLVFPRDFELAKPLIMRYSKIVGSGNNPQGDNGEGNEGEGNQQGDELNLDCPNGCADRKPMKNGRPLSQKEQNADSAKAQEADKQDKAEQLNNKSDDETINGGDGQGDSTHEYNDNVDSEQLEQDTRKTDQDIADMLEQRAKEIRENEQVRREVRNFKEAVDTNSEYNGALKQARYRDEHVSLNSDIDLSAEKFGRELERLEVEAEPTWLRELSSGRLNVERTMNSDINSIDRMFDRWQDADYSTEIEAVILLDNSGSMGYRITEACRSVWAIKRGLERINANTTVYAFNSGSRLLYSATENADPKNVRVLHTGGTTNPLMALKEAEQIFNMSSRTTKLLFIVTDGGFDHSEPCDDYIKAFNDSGVITSTVFIGYMHRDVDVDYIEHYRHYAKYFNVISQPSDLVRIATDIVQGEIGVRVA